MQNMHNRTYLNWLIEELRCLEEENETIESYINEQNFNEFFEEYFSMQKNLSSIHREIDRVGKILGLRKKQIRKIILQD